MSPSQIALLFACLFSAHAQNCQDGSCAEHESPDYETMLSIKTITQVATADETTDDGEISDNDDSSTDNGQGIELARSESMRLSAKLLAAAKAMPADSSTKGLFQSFRICGQCANFKRFGEKHDGGYLMCMDGLQNGATTAAYSLGVEYHDQWSEDVIKHLGIPVNQFDCTVDRSACNSCKFFKKCVVAADGQHPVPGHEKEGWSLQQTLEETNGGESLASIPDGSLLMKMDIESSEWPIYATEPPEALKKFGELIVEFHGLQFEQSHPLYLKAMQHILASGFKVAHLHGNNFEGMYEVGAQRIPRVVEVTFVRGEARPNGCANDQLYNDLDSSNNPANPELPLAHLQ